MEHKMYDPITNSATRMKRGLKLLENFTKIPEKQDGSFAVRSLTSQSVYEVRLVDKIWVCTCPDFEYRETESGHCRDMGVEEG